MARHAKKLKEFHHCLLKEKRGFHVKLSIKFSFFLREGRGELLMPGKKWLQIGNRIKEQMYLLLCNFEELHLLFKSKNSEIKISFSKFAEWRSKE